MNQNTLKAYFASPFFDVFTFEGVEKYANKIRKETGIELYVPQENMDINDKTKVVTNKMIAKGDVDQLKSSDILIAYIDGAEIDSGVSCEIGIWCGREDTIMEMSKTPYEPKPIIAIYSDIRRYGHGDGKFYKNQFVLGEIEFFGYIVKDFHEAIEVIQKIKSEEF